MTIPIWVSLAYFTTKMGRTPNAASGEHCHKWWPKSFCWYLGAPRSACINPCCLTPNASIAALGSWFHYEFGSNLHVDLNMFGSNMEGGIPPVSINTCFDLNQFIIIIFGNLSTGGCLNECFTFFLRHGSGVPNSKTNPLFGWTCPKTLHETVTNPMIDELRSIAKLSHAHVDHVALPGQWFCFAAWWFYHPKGFCRRNVGLVCSSHIKDLNCSEALSLPDM